MEELDEMSNFLTENPRQVYLRGKNSFICLSYRMANSDDSACIEIYEKLHSGLKRLISSISWIGSQIVRENTDKENPDKLQKRIRRHAVPPIVANDLRNASGVPSMDDLIRADFPMRMLDEHLLAPHSQFPQEDNIFYPAPLFFLQANFIKGGLMLTFVGLDCAMDNTGLSRVMLLFNKACLNLPLTVEERVAFDLSADEENILAFREASIEEDALLVSLLPTCSELALFQGLSWAYFIFDSVSLDNLKRFSIDSLDEWRMARIEDALAAFIWQSITRVRVPRLAPSDLVRIHREVDARKLLKLPESYPGTARAICTSVEVARVLVNDPIATIVINCLNTSHVTPLWNTGIKYSPTSTGGLSHETHQTDISLPLMDESTDIFFASWDALRFEDFDFDLGLEKLVSIRMLQRRSGYDHAGFVHLFPKACDSQYVAAICLRDQDMKSLKDDLEFSFYADHLG